jgi:putative ABC transport system ATP-binding protein
MNELEDYVLELMDVWKIYKNGDEVIHALTNINYAFKKGSFNIIHGPSGSGKSTLIRIIGLLESTTLGKVFLNGKDTSDLSQNERNSIINEDIGFIFRSSNLLPTLNAIENLTLPMNSSDNEKATKILDMVGFNDYKKFPSEMSNEESIRVSIARAMVNNHSLIIADEPTGDLHWNESEVIMELLKELTKTKKLTIIITTNNGKLAKYNELIEIVDGTFVNNK